MSVYTHYPELVDSSIWGEDEVLLEKDINLLSKTSFNHKGYHIFPITNYRETFHTLLSRNISTIIGSTMDIDIEKYHIYVNEEQHKQVLNTMPYKKQSHLWSDFSTYIETFMSEILNEKVKIFNDDIWVRICRPNHISTEDFNPCHKDVYFDFYRNTVNIYLPVVGSNEKSSLMVQEGSHLLNENMTAITHG